MRSIMMILGLLFIALCHPSFAQSTEAAAAAPAAAPSAPTVAPEPLDMAPPQWLDQVYELHRPFELNCKPGGGADVPAGNTVWKVNGTEVSAVPALAGRYDLKEDTVYTVARSNDDDWGNYTCLVAGVPTCGFRLKAKPMLKMPDDSNVVEGQKLKLTCRVRGRPFPAVSWTYAAAVGENETDALVVLGPRGSVQASAAGVPGGELLLEAAQRSDAGVYSCHAPGTGAPPAATMLRVKDMYAALWPFLGICAEVFILCAIILVYEKRRTKPELDDSDTDNNHDQ